MENYTPSEYIDKILNGLKSENRFFVENEFNLLLDKICDTHIQTISKDAILYRARIYAESDVCDKYNNPGKYKDERFFGFDEENSFVNKNRSAIPDGRLNPSGIPYLYASFDIDTAIKEVKPYANTAVSVAEIQLLEDIEIVNLCRNDGVAKSDWVSKFIMMLCYKFSNPVYEKGDYLLSQYVSEYIKNKPYDGIAFLSSFTNYTEYAISKKGKNITVFNYDKCKAISSTLYLTKSISIEHKPFINKS